LVSILPALLESAVVSAIHLEVRDEYVLDDPRWVAWRRGDRFDPVEWRTPWFHTMSAATARGVKARRARIVYEPVSEYVRYEYDITADNNLAAGEDVRWLPRRDAVGLLVPAIDFWIFDGSITILNHFAGDGRYLGEERVDDPELTKVYAAAFEEVWQRATPHEHYAI
jgi:hypothetical protein